MGGDSQYLDGWYKVKSTNPKIFRLGDMLIGTERSQRVSDIIQYQMNDTMGDDWPDPADYLVQWFIPKLREALKIGGAMVFKEGTEEMDAVVMIGYKGRLFFIGEDFTLSQIGSDYEAIGAGARYAMGYLYAMQKALFLPEELIENALKCAAHFSAAVSAPFTILEI